jgi:predicted nucleotidyltransferase
MEADLIRSDNEKLKQEYNKEDMDLAYEFTTHLHKEVGKFVKAVVIFGSRARKKKHANDIDMLVIMDDISVVVTKEFVQTYRIIVQNLVAKVSPKIHVTSFKLTSFWELVRKGDPIAINILRDGVPIIDTELFRPLQVLLFQGRIKPSTESVWAYYYKSAQSVQNSRLNMLRATMDLYWAVIDAAQAALMTIHEIPPSPDHVEELVEERLIKPKLIEKRYSGVVSEFYALNKKIETRDIKFIEGKDYDRYLKMADEFVLAMKEFINRENR